MLHEKRILVTGSTHGIGLGIAKSVLAQGARLVLNSHESAPDGLLDELRSLGEVHFIQADLSDVTQVRYLIQGAYDALGGLDHLINNAGTFADVDFLELEEAHFARTFELNVKGYVFAAQAFTRLIGERHWDASVVCVGSTNSLQAEAGGVLYDSSKGAVLMMVRSLAVELSSMQIRVNGVGPGLIRTPLTQGWMDSKPDKVSAVFKQIPAGRIGEPSDVGGTVSYLCSDLSRYVTGQMIYVDGGITAQQMSV